MEDQGGFVLLESISKNFAALEALKDIFLNIERNKITAIVGDNGSGKSTLIKILSGSMKPNGGRIHIEGKSYSYLTPKLAYRMGISTVYQDLSLDNYRDVAGNIFLGKELTKMGGIIHYREMYRQTEALLEKLHIHIPYLTTPVGYLSGGQRQSIAIARSIFQGSRLIIFDEPTAAMGLRESKRINQLIQSLPSKGYTVLMVSHDIHQVYQIADRIFIMQNGRVVKGINKADTTMTVLEEILRHEYPIEERMN